MNNKISASNFLFVLKEIATIHVFQKVHLVGLQQKLVKERRPKRETEKGSKQDEAVAQTGEQGALDMMSPGTCPNTGFYPFFSHSNSFCLVPTVVLGSSKRGRKLYHLHIQSSTIDSSHLSLERNTVREHTFLLTSTGSTTVDNLTFSMSTWEINIIL